MKINPLTKAMIGLTAMGAAGAAYVLVQRRRHVGVTGAAKSVEVHTRPGCSRSIIRLISVWLPIWTIWQRFWRRRSLSLLEATCVPVRTHVQTFPFDQVNEALIALKNDAIRGAGVISLDAASD